MLAKGAGGTHIVLFRVPEESWLCSFEHVCRSSNGHCCHNAGRTGSDDLDRSSSASSYGGYSYHGSLATRLGYEHAPGRLRSQQHGGLCRCANGRVSCHAGARQETRRAVIPRLIASHGDASNDVPMWPAGDHAGRVTAGSSGTTVEADGVASAADLDLFGMD